MRDGVTLCAHVHLPAAEGRFPVLLQRTPYDALARGGELEWPGRGFAFVRQDVRGKFGSEGEWYPWLNEKSDGEDTLEWLTAQPWCNGRVVMYGGSYVSATQLGAAASGHEALKAVTPCLIGSDAHRTCYHGGAFRLGWQTCWTLAPKRVSDQDVIRRHLPLCDLDLFCTGEENRFWRDALAHPRNDAFWREGSMQAHLAEVRTPAFIRTGWFDHFVGDVFDLFNGLRTRSAHANVRKHTRIVVGPWPHNINQSALEEYDFGEAGKLPGLLGQEILFLRHFAGLSVEEPVGAPIRIFVMGANVWRDEQEWPLARTRWVRLHLAGGGKANSACGDGCLADGPDGPPDTFFYDPADPVPTVGGAWDFCNIGPKDQTAVEARSDVLVYTSEILEADLEVTGPVRVRLFAASSAPDTDFTARLVDVDAEGRPWGVTDGIQRARFRGGDGDGQFLVPEEPAEFLIACNPTSWVFRAGHRLRLQISSSNFPAFARHLNSTEDPAVATTMTVARQTVFHTGEFPSCLELPVIPPASPL